VIGIAGRIGAGKTSTGEYLRSRHGFQYLRYSRVLTEWLAKDPESKADLQELGWSVMAKGMQGELNRRLIAQIVPDGDVAVDGLRHSLDFESLGSAFGSSFHLVFLDSPQEARWDRESVRDKYRSLDAFRRADSHPVEQQIGSLQTNAVLVLKNEGSLQDLYTALDEAVRRFRKAGPV